jgi:coenzyme F420-0:L-glutamate ligase/coenzyme F420-1:gamma-L-glutamate ligase
VTVQIFGLEGIGEIRAGDDLAGALIGALTEATGPLRDDDILVVSSKVVSKAEGRAVTADTREAQINAESVRRVAARRTPGGLAQIVQATAGPVMAAAGVDSSNVAPGTVLLLPKDPDASARALRARLSRLTGARLGVILSDTAGRAWRDGQVDFALGAAGVAITDDLRGAVDTHGQRLDVTLRAVADELAAAADLVKGKLAAVPAALIRGCGVPVTDDDGPGAAVLLRAAREDWFRYGHVEAVRLSLGIRLEDVEPPTVPAGDVTTRLTRVLDVAQGGRIPGFAPIAVRRSQDGAEAELSLDDQAAQPDQPEQVQWFELGALAQRISAAAWSEDLAVDVALTGGPPVTLRVTVSEAGE